LTAQASATIPKGRFFARSVYGTGQLTRMILLRRTPTRWIARRAAAAGIATKLGNYSFRATGITAYLKNEGRSKRPQRWQNRVLTTLTMQLSIVDATSSASMRSSVS
jgi:integrase